jgi:hypothetical protein
MRTAFGLRGMRDGLRAIAPTCGRGFASELPTDAK